MTIAASLLGQTVSDILGADANQDGKVSRAEIVALTMPLGMRLFTTLPQLDFQEFLEEVRTSGTDARQEAINVVKERFDIANDELELVIEDVIDFLEDLYTDAVRYFERASDLVSRVKLLKTDAE